MEYTRLQLQTIMEGGEEENEAAAEMVIRDVLLELDDMPDVVTMKGWMRALGCTPRRFCFCLAMHADERRDGGSPCFMFVEKVARKKHRGEKNRDAQPCLVGRTSWLLWSFDYERMEIWLTPRALGAEYLCFEPDKARRFWQAVWIIKGRPTVRALGRSQSCWF